MAGESRFDAAESQSRVRIQLVLTRGKRFVSRSQSERLAAALAEHASIAPLTVIERGGETWIQGLRITGEFRDEDDS
jgi:predicted ATPase